MAAVKIYTFELIKNKSVGLIYCKIESKGKRYYNNYIISVFENDLFYKYFAFSVSLNIATDY